MKINQSVMHDYSRGGYKKVVLAKERQRSDGNRYRERCGSRVWVNREKRRVGISGMRGKGGSRA